MDQCIYKVCKVCEMWGSHSGAAKDLSLLDVTISPGTCSSLFYVQGQAVFSDCLTLNVKALQAFKMFGSTYPTIQCHILEDASLLSGVLTPL